MDELQGKCDNQISAIKHRLQDIDNCGKCGLNHKNGNCSAQGSTCSACGRKNHWARMCHNKKLKKKKNGQAATDEQVYQTKKIAPVQYTHKNTPELYERLGPGSGRFRENVFLFNERPRKKVLLDRGIFPHFTLFYQTGKVSTN